MKYLVVLPEVAYITKNEGQGPIDVWFAKKGKFFQPKTVEIPDETSASEAFQNVEIVSFDNLKRT